MSFPVEIPPLVQEETDFQRILDNVLSYHESSEHLPIPNQPLSTVQNDFSAPPDLSGK